MFEYILYYSTVTQECYELKANVNILVIRNHNTIVM